MAKENASAVEVINAQDAAALILKFVWNAQITITLLKVNNVNHVPLVALLAPHHYHVQLAIKVTHYLVVNAQYVKQQAVNNAVQVLNHAVYAWQAFIY